MTNSLCCIKDDPFQVLLSSMVNLNKFIEKNPNFQITLENSTQQIFFFGSDGKFDYAYDCNSGVYKVYIGDIKENIYFMLSPEIFERYFFIITNLKMKNE
jgi:hypothetical protein